MIRSFADRTIVSPPEKIDGIPVYDAVARSQTERPSQTERVFPSQARSRVSPPEEIDGTYVYDEAVARSQTFFDSSRSRSQTERRSRSQTERRSRTRIEGRVFSSQARSRIIEEAFRESFNESNTVRLRPASKHAVGSLKRKIYKKTSEGVGEIDMCTICLEEFKDGRRIVTLPCGHEFDEKCVLEWLTSSHVCPLCRFKLPH